MNSILGIMGAMPEEIKGIADLLENKQEVVLGQRTYYSGTLNDKPVVVVFSRWGKVAAATTVTTLILRFGITELLFTGVAGGLHPELQIGDIVVASRLIQHDMDARPILPRFEIPLEGITFFEADSILVDKAERLLKERTVPSVFNGWLDEEYRHKFGIQAPTVWVGDIASGDKFIADPGDKEELLRLLPSLICVEMEGAAVAQVCYEYKIPFTVIRTISDTADHNAPMDFPSFIRHVASRYSLEIVNSWVDV
jgi:adenosylhomocysteine nucleosidase